MLQKSGEYNQLRLVDSPIIYEGLKNPNGGCLGFLNHQQYHEILIGWWTRIFIMISENLIPNIVGQVVHPLSELKQPGVLFALRI